MKANVSKTLKANNANTLCPNCNVNSANLFSSKLSKFKREKKAAKNLAIVVGKTCDSNAYKSKPIISPKCI